MQKIHLSAPTGSTEIIIGECLSADLQELDSRPVLMVDENVLCQHHDLFGHYHTLTVPSGEHYKTLDTVEHIYSELLNLEADRSTLLVGVGGGLATDVAGFVASTYLRGVSFGLISSTLLGQVDASIGGKNGVNMEGYKNMIGTIRQPRFVWCDLSLLKTLARKEYIAGIAEVVKYGAIMDVPFLLYLEEHMNGLLDQDPSVLEEVVARCVKAKAGIVERDERESGLRRILNFGHTIGHAIERDLKVLHGQAVSVGMVMAARISVNLGLLSEPEASKIEQLLAAAGLPVTFPLDPAAIFENIRKDKKKEDDALNFILLDGLGKAVQRAIPLDELKRMLHDLC
jgi:3-dehydroquinate synthase